MSDEETEYRVTVTMPFVYRVRAHSREEARRVAIDRWRRKEPAEVGMFPDDVAVEAVDAEDGRGLTALG